MSATHLLDTNILSTLIRDPRGSVRRRLDSVGDPAVATSIVVAAELRFGAAKLGSTRLHRAVTHLLEALPVLPFEQDDDLEYAELRTELERAGTPIGPNDLLIASQARRRELTVVTANVREFAHVPRLHIEDWTQ